MAQPGKPAGGDTQIQYNMGGAFAASTLLTTDGKSLRVGSVKPDPLGLGTPANSMLVDETGASAWAQYVSGGNNWFAQAAGACGGTVTAPVNTAFSSIVFEQQGYAWSGGKWHQVTSTAHTALNVPASGQPTGQFSIFAYGTEGVNNASILTVDGDVQRMIFGSTRTKNIFAMLKSAAAGPQAPGQGVLALRVVPGTNPGTAKIVVCAGDSDVEVTLIDNVGSGF